jgi:hypothetical protein
LRSADVRFRGIERLHIRAAARRLITVTSGGAVVNEIDPSTAEWGEGAPVRPAAVAPASALEEKAQRLAAAKKQRKANKTKPLKFVVFTLGLWWVLSVLADLVITCSPGGPPCRAPYLIEATKRHVASIFNDTVQISAAGGPVALTKYEWPLLIISLLGALWVAKAKVYPRTDETEEFTEQELDET